MTLETFYIALRLLAWASIAMLCLLSGCGHDDADSRYGRVAAMPSVKRAMLPNGSASTDDATDGVDEDPDADDDAASEVAELCDFLWRARDVLTLGPQGTEETFTSSCFENLTSRSATCLMRVRALNACLTSPQAVAQADAPHYVPGLELAVCEKETLRFVQQCSR